METRIFSILSGGVESLSIREILEYCINDSRTDRIAYDYCWSEFPTSFNMNVADLLDVMSVLAKAYIYNDIKTLFDMIVAKYEVRENEPLESFVGPLLDTPPSKLFEQNEDVDELCSVADTLISSYKSSHGKTAKPLGYRPEGFDPSLYDRWSEIQSRFWIVARELPKKNSRYNLSVSDITIWNCSALYAKKNLTTDEYRCFVEIYDACYKNKENRQADLHLYQLLHGRIMEKFEYYFPYTLIYYASAHRMTDTKENMYRSWYKNGIRGNDAVNKFYKTISQ